MFRPNITGDDISITRQAIGLVMAGLAAAVAVCWPFAFGFTTGQPVWWLQIMALAWMVHCLREASNVKQAFAYGGLFATAWLIGIFWWLFVAMHTYGGLPSGLASAAVIALALALSLYYAAAAALYWTWGRSQPLRASVLFAAVWTMAEMARGTWLTGFGWGGMAYAHTQGPLATWIPVVGSYGLCALAAWLAASLGTVRRTGTLHRMACLALIGLGWLPVGLHSTAPTGTLSVALLQGNIPQDEKFESSSGIPVALRWYADHMHGKKADAVFAPETAIPVLPQDLPAGYWDDLRARTALGHSALITGIPLGDYQQGYTNSVIALQPQSSAVWRYDKHHLVPFGEFIPPLFKWFTRLMHIPLGDFNRGALGQPSFEWKGQRIAANICYEDLFGEELAARFADPSTAPTLFANISNLGWFGDTIAMDQHLQISRMRALEFERPFVRATNTGATAILDYHGHVTASLPRMTQGVLEGVVEGRTGITPYAWWASRFGLWPLWLLALAVVGLAWRMGQRGTAP